MFEAESTKIHYTYGDSYTANTATEYYLYWLRNAGGMLVVVLVRICERF